MFEKFIFDSFRRKLKSFAVTIAWFKTWQFTLNDCQSITRMKNRNFELKMLLKAQISKKSKLRQTKSSTTHSASFFNIANHFSAQRIIFQHSESFFSTANHFSAQRIIFQHNESSFSTANHHSAQRIIIQFTTHSNFKTHHSIHDALKIQNSKFKHV